MKLVVDFTGKSLGNIVSKPVKGSTRGEVCSSVLEAVGSVRPELVKAQEKGQPITMKLPDDAVLACATLQAVRGLLGSVPFVALPNGEEVDLEEIREVARELRGK